MLSNQNMRDLNGHTTSWYDVKKNGNKPFDPTSYFSHLHHVEEWDKDKRYEKEMMQDFGKGLRRYRQQYWTVKIDDHGNNSVQHFVASEEVLSDADRTSLIPWCQCSSCVIPWYKPWEAADICRCCVGCLCQDVHTTQRIIDRTRQYKKDHPTMPERHDGFKVLGLWLFSPFGMLIGIAVLFFILIDLVSRFI